MESEKKLSLTPDDLEAIGDAVAARLPMCSLGLTTTEAVMIKGHLGFYRKACNLVGTILVTTVVIFIIGLFTRGFWFAITENMKK